MLVAEPQSAATIAAGLDDVRMVVPPVGVIDAWLDTVPWGPGEQRPDDSPPGPVMTRTLDGGVGRSSTMPVPAGR
jgi:hypothetical protein